MTTDTLLKCRLCGSSKELILPISEALNIRIKTLFQLEIGGPNDRLTCYICGPCTATVTSTWHFWEQVQQVQENLLKELSAGTLFCAESDDETNEKHVESLQVSMEAVNKENGRQEEAKVTLVYNNELSNDGTISEDPLVSSLVSIETVNFEDKLSIGREKENNIKEEETVVETYETSKESSDLSKSNSLRWDNNSETKVKEEADKETDKATEEFSDLEQSSNQGWSCYPWTCSECNQRFLSYKELKDHCDRIHEQETRFACVDCPEIYTTYIMFIMHVRSHRPYLKFYCDVCNKRFQWKKQQEAHRSEHGDFSRPYGCSTCGKFFCTQTALYTHKRTHLPRELKNRYQCDQCLKCYGTNFYLQIHKKLHANVRDYACDQCPKRFSSKGYLTTHKRTHDNTHVIARNYSCDRCGKCFALKGTLADHMISHESERPFSCATCSKAFKTMLRLKKHAKLHLDFEPHVCDVCGKQCRERSKLEMHLKIHTDELPFTCEFCAKRFRTNNALKIHRRQHTGERPYSCMECQHHFANCSNYSKHMKRRHGVNASVRAVALSQEKSSSAIIGK